MDNLLRQLHSQMAAYSMPPTELGDGNLVLRAEADNEILQYHLMVLKNNQHQLLTTTKARELIEEKTIKPHPPVPTT